MYTENGTLETEVLCKAAKESYRKTIRKVKPSPVIEIS